MSGPGAVPIFFLSKISFWCFQKNQRNGVGFTLGATGRDALGPCRSNVSQISGDFLGSGKKELKHDEICCFAYLLDIFEIDIWWYMMILIVSRNSDTKHQLTSWLVQCYFAAKWGSACACGNAYQRMYCAQGNRTVHAMESHKWLLFWCSTVLLFQFPFDRLLLWMLLFWACWTLISSLWMSNNLSDLSQVQAGKPFLVSVGCRTLFQTSAFWNNEGHVGSVYRQELSRIMKKDWTDIRRHIADFRCKLGPQFAFSSMSWETLYKHANWAPRETGLFFQEWIWPLEARWLSLRWNGATGCGVIESPWWPCGPINLSFRRWSAVLQCIVLQGRHR